MWSIFHPHSILPSILRWFFCSSIWFILCLLPIFHPSPILFIYFPVFHACFADPSLCSIQSAELCLFFIHFPNFSSILNPKILLHPLRLYLPPFFFLPLWNSFVFCREYFLTNPRVGSDFLFIHFTICFSFNFLAISFILLHPLYHTFGIHFSVMFFILFHPLLYIVSNPLPSLDCQVVWQRGFQPSGYIWFFPHPLSSKFSSFSIHFTRLSSLLPPTFTNTFCPFPLWTA